MCARAARTIRVLGSSGTENTVKASGGGLLCRLGWISERPELPTLNGIGQRERIPAQQFDVVEYQGRQTRKILRFYGKSLSSKLLQSGIDVDGVPEHDDLD
jgi:hypothetical protein